MKKTRFILLLLVLIGLVFVTGCSEQQLPGDDTDDPDVVDCEKNPEHESCKDPGDDKDPDQNPDGDYPYSLGFTIYELQDSNGNLLNGYAVGDYKGTDTEVLVPAVWKDKPVIKIIDKTFENNDKITKVVIPSSVKLLGNNVFAKCKSLTEVEFAGVSELQVIPTNAFYECTSLKSFTVPASVIKIEKTAFYGCSSIRELAIPASVKAIGEGAFAAMTSLSKITLPFVGGGATDSTTADLFGFVFNTVYTEYTTPIDQKVSDKNTITYYIPTALKTVEILDGPIGLAYGAFSGLTNVEKLILPKSIERFGDNCFYGVKGLTDIYFRGEDYEWAKIAGKYTEGNVDTLDAVEVTFNYAE
ncbi:MAG: leucine-rich repeat protein [Bacilli bacterium]|nr:leucine-rich repeat protein [Bacilli bacterium]